jgi:PAS domain-containing protein
MSQSVFGNMTKKKLKLSGAYFLERVGEESWTYIKTVVDIVREPILILDKDLRVMSANEPFCKLFKVESKDTEGKVVYKLGNGQWNILVLRKLLEDILPEHTFFRGFEVSHNFPIIGQKTMILNARQIYCKDDVILGPCPPIILLAMEDITEMMAVADKLAGHTNELKNKLITRTEKLEVQIRKLEREICDLKDKRW